MKQNNLFYSDGKQNLAQQLTSSEKKTKELPQKYCPNCGMKHQVEQKEVFLKGFPPNIKHIELFIRCADEEGDKIYGKYLLPQMVEVVDKAVFFYRKEDLINE